MGNLKNSLLLVLATGLMGSSFAISQMGLHYVSPLLLAGLRFGLAGLILALLVRGRRHPNTKRVWARIALIGLLQTTGVMGAIFLSLTTITAGESAILTFTNPVLVVVLSAAFMGSRYRLAQWGGAALGLVGVAVAIGATWHLHTGMVYGLASAIFWAVATLLMKHWGRDVDLWVMTAYQMLIGGVCLVILGTVVAQPMFHLSLASVAILAWLVVMASIIQFGAWFYVLHHGDPARASSYLFLAPVFGVLSGWLLLGQSIGWHVAIGAPLIMVGIWLVNQRRVEAHTMTEHSLRYRGERAPGRLGPLRPAGEGNAQLARQAGKGPGEQDLCASVRQM